MQTAWTHTSGERDASFLVSKTYVLDLGGRSEQGFSEASFRQFQRLRGKAKIREEKPKRTSKT